MLIRAESSAESSVVAEPECRILVQEGAGGERHLGRSTSLEAARAGAGEHGVPKEALSTLDLLGGFPGEAEEQAGAWP